MNSHKEKSEKEGKPLLPVQGFFNMTTVKELGLQYDSVVILILHQITDLLFTTKSLTKVEEVGYVKFWYSIQKHSETLALSQQAMKRALERMKKINLLYYIYEPQTHIFQIVLNARIYRNLISETHLMKAKGKTSVQINDFFVFKLGSNDFDEKRFLNLINIKADSKTINKNLNKKLLSKTKKKNSTEQILYHNEDNLFPSEIERLNEITMRKKSVTA